MAMKYTIPSKYEHVTRVSDKINNFMTSNNIAKEVADDFEICLLEALNNIIKHSYLGSEDYKIDISVTISDDKIEVELQDTGNPKTNTGKAKLDFDPDDIENLPEGGMGLYIIENLMDETHYFSENNLNTYRLIKFYHKK